jgi:dipeptidase D
MSLDSANREVLRGLEPQPVWDRFRRIAEIPRDSNEEDEVRAHVIAWARERGYSFQIDGVGNLLVRVPGRREGDTLLLQAHLDMVCVPKKGAQNSPADFGVELELGEDGWLHSKGNKTSVGADNGVGVATMMALVDDKDVNYPPLELLFTVDEENGLSGVGGLDIGMITAERVINMDSEDGPNLTGIASAAGRGMKAVRDAEYSPIVKPGEHRLVVVKADGFQGGHSGLAINNGLGNPIKVLAQTLRHGGVGPKGFDLLKLEGGSGAFGNVIPTGAELHLAVENTAFEGVTQSLGRGAQAALQGINNPGTVTVEGGSASLDPAAKVLGDRVKSALVGALQELPDGVLTRRKIPEGAPDVSSNLGWVRTGDGVEVVACLRGHTVTDLDAQFGASKGIFSSRGFKLVDGNGKEADLFGYGGWEINPDSALLAHGEAVMRGLGMEPKRWAYHCGLEVGELVMTMETAGRKMDAIASGPHIRDVHSTNERIQVSSVEDWYRYLKEFLRTV